MVYIHLAEGFEEIEALACVDILRRAEIEAQLVSLTGNKTVKSVRGIGVEADILYEDAHYDKCRMIVLPGGMPGAKNMAEHEGLVKHINCFNENRKWIAAICAAPMILGAQGILQDKRAVIYTGMESHLKGAKVSSERVVVDGHIITSKGPGTAMEFALAIVEALKGKETYEKLRIDLVMPDGK